MRKTDEKDTPQVTKEAYTLEESAGLFGIGRKPMTVAIRTGQIPAIRIGRRWFIPKVALERLLRQDAKPTSETAR